MSQFFELNVALGELRGEHFRLGSSLHQVFREAGFNQPQVDSNFVLLLRGEREESARDEVYFSRARSRICRLSPRGLERMFPWSNL